MNRNDLQQIALIRLKEAKTLLNAGHYSGAYYVSGYAIECALKACIAKHTKRYDFPNKKIASDSYTHDLILLMKVAGLQTALDQEMRRDAIFAVNWAIVKDWTVDSRYEMHSQKTAQDIYKAISNTRHGVMRWLKHHW